MSDPTSIRAELRALVRLAWPIASAQVGLVAMGLVDIAILGRVSVADLAGAAIGRSLGYSSATLAMGVGMALEPLASQALGAGEPGRAWSALTASLKAAVLLWLPTFAAAFAVTLLLEPFGVDREIATRAQRYLLGHAPGLALTGIFFCGKTYLQAHGKTRPVLMATIAANVVNAVVCSVLVRGDAGLVAFHLPALGLPPLGAFGAGLANSIATVILVVVTLRAAFWLRGPPEGRGPALPVRKILVLGLPVGFQLTAEMGVFTLVALLMGRLGKEMASAHQVAIGLASFTYMGAIGVSGATAVRVGRAIGEGRSTRRAGLLGIALGGGVMTVGALVFASVPRLLVAAFTTDPEVIAVGTQLLWIAAVFQLFDGVQAVASGALRGAGDVRFAFVANVVAYWVIGLPIALFLGFGLHWGAPGLWWGLTLGLAITSVLLARRFVVLSRGPIARI